MRHYRPTENGFWISLNEKGEDTIMYKWEIRVKGTNEYLGCYHTKYENEEPELVLSAWLDFTSYNRMRRDCLYAIRYTNEITVR